MERKYAITIRSGRRTIVSTDDFSVHENEIAFLFGESGIGKSMLSKAVYGLLDPDELRIEINGAPYYRHLFEERTRRIQQSSFFVFQEPSSHLDPLMKISEQLAEGSLRLAPNRREILDYLWQSADRRAIDGILEVYPKPYRPSGGEKQRLLLAMAFEKIELLLQSADRDQPTNFVFDEPTGSLDDNYRNLFLRLLFDKYRQRPFTVSIITHDYSIISEILRSHADIKGRVHFKELGRTGEGTVSLRDFSADAYVQWLAGERRKAHRAAAADTVLDVDPRMRVFGRDFSICKDSNRALPANLIIRKGDMAYLKAPSGTGKTTMAKIIMGLFAPERFSMTLSAEKVTERTPPERWRKKIWGKTAGMVFQHADEALDLQARVRECFAGLPLRRRPTLEWLRAQLQTLFSGEISPAFMEKKAAYLSGGQKQRLNLLRTLALNTDLIVLDEPLNGLDFSSVQKVLSILEEKRKQGSALLMISHNEEIFDAIADRESVYYLAAS